MNKVMRRAQYTQEFRQEAVRQVRAGKAISEIGQTLGIPKATLGKWVRQSVAGAPTGSVDKGSAVSVEQMELTRLRAENARLRMECEIAKKAAAYFA